MASQVIQTYVKYQEYYVYIPKVGIRIKPFQLWRKHYVDLFRTSNWLLVLGVVLLLAVHLEEILVSPKDVPGRTYGLSDIIVLGILDPDDQVTACATMVPLDLLQVVVCRVYHLHRGLLWCRGDRDGGVDEG